MEIKRTNITFGNAVIVDLKNPKTNKIHNTSFSPEYVARSFVDEKKLLTGLDKLQVMVGDCLCLVVDGDEREMLNGLVQDEHSYYLKEQVSKILVKHPKTYKLSASFLKKLI